MPRISTAPVLREDVFTNICNVLSMYTDTYLYTNTTLYIYDYKHANAFESIKNININISCSEENAAMQDVHHTGLSLHNEMQNVADSLIVQKTMQLCWTFITRDCLHTMGCKTLLTL